MSQNSTLSDTFDEIQQVVLDRMSDNMSSFVESVKYGAIKNTDTTTNAFYVIMLTSEACKVEDNTKIDGKTITAG